MAKRKRREEPPRATNLVLPESCTKEDAISRLPDNILQFIISKLSAREGAATCILSRSWRTLWTSSVSRLDFDIPTIFGNNIPRYRFRDKCFTTRKRWEFSQWVDRVLYLRSSSSVDLDSLRVCFPLSKRSSTRVNRWIKSALALGVTDIELDFSDIHDPFHFSPKDHDLYVFPTTEDEASLKCLRLKCCVFHGFASLTSLSLDQIVVTQRLVDNIFVNCPLLECLSLAPCCFSATTSSLTFSGPSCLLKHLNVHTVSHRWTRPKMIEVRDANLTSLELRGYIGNISVKNVPRLAKLVLWGNMGQHASAFSGMHTLEILFLEQAYTRWISLHSTLVFCNLKRLVLVTEGAGTLTSHPGVIHLLKTFCSLQELELNMGSWNGVRIESSKLTTVPHYSLKEVEMYEFGASPEKIAFVKYLLNYAVVLEKMKIYTASKVYLGNGNWTLHERSTEEVESLEEVHEQLRKVAPCSTKLELSSSPKM